MQSYEKSLRKTKVYLLKNYKKQPDNAVYGSHISRTYAPYIPKKSKKYPHLSHLPHLNHRNSLIINI